MGKLIRNGIEYGGGNGTDIFEVTQAQYNALKTAGTLVRDALYVITDAPNLNATAQDLSYDGGATSTHDEVESLKTSKQDKLLILSGEKTGSGGVIPNGVNTYSVAFGKTYASKPAVQVCFSSSTSQFLASEVQKCCTSNVTTTGFDIITACAQSRYATIQWLAIGYEAT